MSKAIRIVLWLLMLIGGAWYCISKDLNTPLFGSFWFHVVSFVIGFVIVRLAFNAAGAGGRELAKMGREGDVPRLETNKLVTSGIYSCLRHPMLFGLTLLPLGLAFLLGSVTFITFVAPLEMLFIIFMVATFEEMEIYKKFGDDYLKYKREVPMVSFKKECLKRLFFKLP